jgi:8-oxo-dGTP diphosphatase
MIDVCCAIILKDSKILAVQRGLKSIHPWQWEFPGGKIQDGETAEQGIIREIEEELCIRIDILTKLEPVEFDYGFRQVKLIPFVCSIFFGEINLTEHIAKQWLEYAELSMPEWSAADRELIVKNQKSLKQLLLKADS